MLIFIWIVTLVAAGALAAAFAWFSARASRLASRELEETAPFCPERYQPMGALLSREDEESLAAMPGYRAEIGARFRRDRRRIFRMYLNDLRRDFQRLHLEARRLAAHSNGDSRALIGMLVRQQLAFWLANAALELRLAAHAFGVGPVDVRAVVGSVESMRLSVNRFQAAPSRPA